MSDLRGSTAGFAAERRKWDEHAERATEQELSVTAPDFAAHAATVGTLAGVPELLGDLRGKRLVEYGCGGGACTTLLAKSGAHVTAFDLSPRSVDLTRQRAAFNGVEIDVVEAAAEELPFPDESFDIAFGHAVLHHLEPERGRAELLRILRPGGKAIFSEPLGTNPLLTLLRQRAPYPGKTDRGIDRPLTYRDLAWWSEGFREFDFREIQLFAMVERLFDFARTFPRLTRFDGYVLERLPFLRRFCRYVVLCGVK